jgi:hypothetical protein
VLSFVDASGAKRKAIVRYDGANTLEVLLYDSTGRVARLTPIEGGYLGEAKAVRLQPGYDSIFYEYTERTLSPFNSIFTIIDPSTCEAKIIGSIYQNGSSFADCDGVKAPNSEMEKAYCEKEASEQGVPTKELAVRESADPKWANFVWVLNNESLFKEEPQGHLKLHWYTQGNNVCSASPDKSSAFYLYKNYKVRGPINGYGYYSIEICDTENQQWSELFLALGYKSSVDSLEIQGPNVILKESKWNKTWTINLDTWDWHQGQ